MSQTLLRGKHLITFQEWNKNEINMALDVAGDLKRRFATGEPHRLLQDKTLFMMLEDDVTECCDQLKGDRANAFMDQLLFVFCESSYVPDRFRVEFNR